VRSSLEPIIPIFQIPHPSFTEFKTMPDNRRDYFLLPRVLLVLVALFLSFGCSGRSQENVTTEDTTYLTPVPQATLDAFRQGIPVESKLEAVIAARAALATTRLIFSDEPRVISVAELSLENVGAHLGGSASAANGKPGDTNVWLVMFEGNWQVVPPDPARTVTPPPPTLGCVYAVIYAADGASSDIGTMDCDS
jgi:hypothetical protein